MSSITGEAHRLRGIAESGPIGKRHSSFELYDLLAGCMALADRCKQPDEYNEIKRLVMQQPSKGNRRYIEKGSDEYILVCRFVFGNLRSAGAERSNASRYAHCLREAAKQGVTSKTLAKTLSDNGGINALFLSRPLEATTFTTRCLNLAAPITIAKDEVFSLTLRRMADNRYDVIGDVRTAGAQ